MTYPFQLLVAGHRPSINLSQGNALWSEWGDTDQYWQGTCQWKTNTRGQCSLNYRGVTYCWTNIRSRCESYNSQQRKMSYSYHAWFLWLSCYLVVTVSQGCTEMALVSRVTEQELQMLFLCHVRLAVMGLLHPGRQVWRPLWAWLGLKLQPLVCCPVPLGCEQTNRERSCSLLGKGWSFTYSFICIFIQVSLITPFFLIGGLISTKKKQKWCHFVHCGLHFAAYVFASAESHIWLHPYYFPQAIHKLVFKPRPMAPAAAW